MGIPRGATVEKSQCMMPADNTNYKNQAWLEDAVAEDWWKTKQAEGTKSQKASNDTQKSLDFIL